MARPERRKSSLAAASPIGPQSLPATATPTPAPAHLSTGATTVPSSTSSSTAPTASIATERSVGAHQQSERDPKAPKTRIGPYVHDDEANRVRAAYLHGWTRENQGSFTDFLKSAIMRTVEDLENAHNGGQPWPTVGGNAVKSVAQMNVEAAKRQQR